MIPGSVPRPVDGQIRYSNGALTGYRVFEPPAAACPRENGNLVLIAAGRPRRKSPAPAPAEAIRPDALASPGVSFPPDDDPDEDADDGPP